MKKNKEPSQAGLKINSRVLWGAAPGQALCISPDEAWRMYAPPRTLGASEEAQLAMDAHLQECGYSSLISHAIGLGMGFSEIAPQFLGYPYLAGLSQNGLIRAGVTTVAEEMTKRWVEIKREGADSGHDKGVEDKIKRLSAAFLEFDLQNLFNEAAQKCDFDGGCLIYIDTGEDDNEALARPLYLDRASIRQGSIRRFTLVEALNLYPGPYNAVNPLYPDYYTPECWMVLGRKIHRSRFLYFAPNKLNMLLRPAYNFFGIPAAQLVLDYVGHFTKTREAAMRLLTKFSMTVFKSDVLATVLSGGGAEHVDRRMQYLSQWRDNDSILLIDKEREDIIKLETPLGGVTDIVRQALEFVAAVFRLPVVKLLGISPAGMNATGEFDERNFYQHVAAKQQKILSRPLSQATALLQLHCFGETDPMIKAGFVPLTDEDDNQKAQVRKTEAERDALYLSHGVISKEEVRRKLSLDSDSDFAFIEPASLD